MEKIILLSPAVIGLILILTGIFFFLKRTKSGYHTTGKIIDVKKSIKKITGVKTITHAPVVKYEIKGKEYQTVSYKFFPEDSISHKCKARDSFRLYPSTLPAVRHLARKDTMRAALY